MKPKRLTPLSHKDWKRNYEPTSNPRIVAIRLQAEDLSKRIKKEGIQ